MKVLVAQSYLTLGDPRDCSLPGSSVHRIDFPGKNAEEVCHCLLLWPRDRTSISCVAGRFFPLSQQESPTHTVGCNKIEQESRAHTISQQFIIVGTLFWFPFRCIFGGFLQNCSSRLYMVCQNQSYPEILRLPAVPPREALLDTKSSLFITFLQRRICIRTAWK